MLVSQKKNPQSSKRQEKKPVESPIYSLWANGARRAPVLDNKKFGLFLETKEILKTEDMIDVVRKRETRCWREALTEIFSFIVWSLFSNYKINKLSSSVPLYLPSLFMTSWKILCWFLLDFSCCVYQTWYPPFFATLDVLSVEALSDNLLFEEEVKVGLEY